MQNREIKFRVWDKEKKHWVDPNKHSNDGVGITFSGKLSFCDQSYFGNTDRSGNYVIQQFTGLKDKNGKEIYEGDILKDDCKEHCILDFSPLVKVVYYNEDASFTGIDLSDYYMTNLGIHVKHSIIIGNIFENPELSSI